MTSKYHMIVFIG